MSDGGFGAVFARSGLSLEQAEEELGVSTRQIRRYVAGEAEPPAPGAIVGVPQGKDEVNRLARDADR